MAHSEILSKEMIRIYLDALADSFSVRPPVPEKALEILFTTRLFSECIREIKTKMHLSCGLRVYYHDDDTFPEPRAAAFIQIPNPMPRFASKAFDNLSLEVRLKKSLRDNYHRFVYNVAHEMSHIVLHSTGHRFKDSEVATDLFVMVCGFENIMEKGRIGYGYLDTIHFLYAQKYLKRIRQGKRGKTFREKIESLFK